MKKNRGYWDDIDKCKEEALKYNTRFKFQKESPSCYSRCFKNGWLDVVCSHMLIIRKKWSKDDCLKEALKYKTKKEFRENSVNVYNICIQNKWLDEICSHMGFIKNINGYWNYERCKEESLKYKTKKEFKNNCGSAYNSAIKNNWLNEICSHMIVMGDKYKRLIYVYEFPDKCIYIGLTSDFKRRNNQHLTDIKSPVYKYKEETGLMPEYKILTNYIDVKEAQKLEIELIEKYKKENYIVLNSRKGGELGISNLYWTYILCKEEALKYKTRNLFKNNSNGAYNSARKNKWLDDFYPKLKTGLK